MLHRQFCVVLFFMALLSAMSACHFERENPYGLELNEPIGDDEEVMLERKRYYLALIHRAAPGTDWHQLEVLNRQSLEMLQRSKWQQRSASNTSSTFADGLLTGSWTERGSRNVAGNVRYMDYVPASNRLYLISDGGILWQGDPDQGNWQMKNQQMRFNPTILKHTVNANGGNRLLVAADNNMQYSDDDGATFTAAVGVDFPIAWGGNYIADIALMNDAAGTIYCLARPWDPTPWSPRFWLYRSTDHGETYNKIYGFDFGNDNQLSLFSPPGSAVLYMLDVNSSIGQSTLFRVDGASVSIVNQSGDLPVNTRVVLKGFQQGDGMIFYAMSNNNMLYRSTNYGLNWTLRSNLPAASWDRLEVSPTVPGTIMFGGVDAYRSTDDGVSWELVTGGWGAYYGNMVGSLHADIMQIQCFKKLDNTEFTAVTCHGGYYISYDHLATVSNKSLLNLNTAQTWDVITDRNDNQHVYLGSQDQGIQCSHNALSNPGMLDFVQFYSGDYGQLVITDSAPSKLWIEYPGGNFSFYTNPASINSYYGYDAQKTITGTNLPNYGWMLPAANSGNLKANEILVGGGNMSGGGGSYLVKFKASVNTLSIVDSQYSYNFRANSNNGSSGISAIEASLISNKLFVATEDGTFFYSNNNGFNWSKSASFSGPTGHWLYGSCILASQLNSNVVWYSGSGYSNPGVYKSVDGGVSFVAMSNGLPSTLVHEVVATADEQLLFAATEAGPYVYIAAKDQWYSLTDSNTPLVDYFTLEYLPAQNIVRFGTYGRGIWDFKIESVNLNNLICAGSSIVYSSNTTGNSYQWQVNTGSGFVNLANGPNYSGVNTANLQVSSIPTTFYGYQYRCNVAGVFSNVFTLKITSYWKGGFGTAWEEPRNWNCGVIPDGQTDVFINPGATTLPQVNSNASCRSLNVPRSSSVRIATGAHLSITH